MFDDVVIVSLMGIKFFNIFVIVIGFVLVIVVIVVFYFGLCVNFDLSVGFVCLIYVFEVVIIGGFGLFWGILIGGIFIGVV